MATSAQLARPTTRLLRPVELWHLLSLDAPTVAALWTWFLARAAHVSLPLISPTAMALAVWILYAADRILDARPLDASPLKAIPELEARHLFHHRHRRAFLWGIGLASVALAALLPRLEPAAIRLYLVEGSLLFAWFLILHASGHSQRLPKEFAVGLFFAAAVFIPTVARSPRLRLALAPDAILLALLCSLNCLYIYAWEHQGGRSRFVAAAHPTTQLAVRCLNALTFVAAAAALALGVFAHTAPRPIALACGLTAAIFLLLDRSRSRLTPAALRVYADLALLTPLAVAPLIR